MTVVIFQEVQVFLTHCSVICRQRSPQSGERQTRTGSCSSHAFLTVTCAGPVTLQIPRNWRNAWSLTKHTTNLPTVACLGVVLTSPFPLAWSAAYLLLSREINSIGSDDWKLSKRKAQSLRTIGIYSRLVFSTFWKQVILLLSALSLSLVVALRAPDF